MTRWLESWLELYDFHWVDWNIALLLGRTSDAAKIQIPVIKITLSGITFLAKYRRIVVCLHVTNNKIEKVRFSCPSEKNNHPDQLYRSLHGLDFCRHWQKRVLMSQPGEGGGGYKELLYSNFAGWGLVDYL